MEVKRLKFSNQALITLPVIFEGARRETLVLALDTGATYSMIPWKIAQSLGLTPETARLKILITTASSTEEVPLITIPILRIAGKVLRQSQAVVHDLPPSSRIDGLLGLNTMRALKLMIDFAAQEIVFTDS